MIAAFERKALDWKLRDEQHTCLLICLPEHHFHFDELREEPYRVTWRDRAMVVLDFLGSISM